MSHPLMHARRIVTAITSSRINLTTESAAHRDIEKALASAGIEHTSEVRLSERERIDVLCGTVGVEIKVGHARRDIWRQLQRYAAFPEIEALVLATGTAFPTKLTEVDGKPLFVADLSKGWL